VNGVGARRGGLAAWSQGTALASAEWVSGIPILNGREVWVVGIWWGEVAWTQSLLFNIISRWRSNLPAWACCECRVLLRFICSRAGCKHVGCSGLLQAHGQCFALTLGTNNCLGSIGTWPGNKFGAHALGPLWGAKPVRRRFIKNNWFSLSVVGIWGGGFSECNVVHPGAFLVAKLWTAEIFENELGFWMVRSWTREFFFCFDELFVATVRSYNNLSANIMLTLQWVLGRNLVVHVYRGVSTRTRVFVFGAKRRRLYVFGSHWILWAFTDLRGWLVSARSWNLRQLLVYHRLSLGRAYSPHRSILVPQIFLRRSVCSRSGIGLGCFVYGGVI